MTMDPGHRVAGSPWANAPTRAKRPRMRPVLTELVAWKHRHELLPLSARHQRGHPVPRFGHQGWPAWRPRQVTPPAHPGRPA